MCNSALGLQMHLRLNYLSNHYRKSTETYIRVTALCSAPLPLELVNGALNVYWPIDPDPIDLFIPPPSCLSWYTWHGEEREDGSNLALESEVALKEWKYGFLRPPHSPGVRPGDSKCTLSCSPDPTEFVDINLDGASAQNSFFSDERTDSVFTWSRRKLHDKHQHTFWWCSTHLGRHCKLLWYNT